MSDPIAIPHREPDADDRLRRGELRRYRAMATGLLGLTAVCLVASHYLMPPGFWAQLIRAACEAALVGGLADWFAVTALFRRPLGLPIPHTAIVPRAKDRIAEGLGLFVTRNFLDPKILSQRLSRLDPASAIARRMSDPAIADALGERLAAGLPVILNSLEDRELRKFVGEALAINVARADLSPLAAKILRGLVDAGEHGPIIEALARLARDLLIRSEGAIRAEISVRSSWWIPRMVDDKLAASVSDALLTLLMEMERATSPGRLALDEQIAGIIHRLEHDPSARAAFEGWKQRLLAQPGTQAALAKSWDALKSILLPAGGSADARMAAVAGAGIQSLGQALADNPAMRARLNRRLKVLALGALVPLRGAIGGFITDVVRAWDGRTLTDRIELSVGRDLQYIRVSGTLVGALVGTLLFLINVWVFGA